MLTHHAIWLEAHPSRSKEWLEDRLADGFDVHHIDGDHGNNDPENLVLIEHQDHMSIHSLNLCRIAAIEIRKLKTEKRRKLQTELGYRSGNFHKRTVKGAKYWYFFDNHTKKQKYVCREGPNDHRFSAYNASRKLREDWLLVSNGLPIGSAEAWSA